MTYQNNRSSLGNSFVFINTALFGVFFLLLPIIFTNQVFETASLPRHILATVITCLLLFTFTIQLFINKTELKFNLLHFGLFLFFGWALLSILWSQDKLNSITELTQLFSYFAIAFFASQLEYKQIRNIFLAIFVSASIAAILGILQAFNINPLDLRLGTALASTFNNKNHASVFFDLVIPIALISTFTNTSYKKYIAGFVYTLAITFILLAKTKGSLLGFVIFTLFFLIIVFKNKSIQKQFVTKKNIFQYVFLSIIIPISIYGLTTLDFSNANTPKEWNTGLTKSSTSIRLSWYKNAYAMLKENPIAGVGYGAFRKGFSPYASNPNIVESLTEDQAVAQLHNDSYQLFLELGLVGGGIILFIFSYMIFKGIKLLVTIEVNNKGSPNYLLLGSLLALISSITHSFVDFPLRLPSSATLFWFLTGITILLLNNLKPTITFKNTALRLTTGIIVFFLSIVLLLHGYNLYSKYFSASKLTYTATVSVQKEKNCTKAKSEIDKAINLFFADPFIRQRYVQIYISCVSNLNNILSAMNKVLNYDGTNARARLTRAIIYLNNQKLNLASADFNYLIYVLPHRPAAYVGLGDIATLNKNYKKARTYYEKVIRLDASNSKANFMLKQFNDKNI